MHVFSHTVDLFPFNKSKTCTIDTSTKLIYTSSSSRGGNFELLDDVNCTEYKLSQNNDGSSGAIPISVPFSLFHHTHNTVFVSISYTMYC